MSRVLFFLVAILVALMVALAPVLLARASGPLVFANATYTGAPSCTDALLPALNPDTALHLCAVVRRPPAGGGMRIVSLFTADGEQRAIDMAGYGYQDCFGAAPWPSRFSGTLKAVVNCKVGDGNDREMVFIDTGLAASPEH